MKKIKYNLYALKLKRCKHNKSIVVGSYSCIECVYCLKDDKENKIITCNYGDKMLEKLLNEKIPASYYIKLYNKIEKDLEEIKENQRKILYNLDLIDKKIDIIV